MNAAPRPPIRRFPIVRDRLSWKQQRCHDAARFFQTFPVIDGFQSFAIGFSIHKSPIRQSLKTSDGAFFMPKFKPDSVQPIVPIDTTAPSCQTAAPRFHPDKVDRAAHRRTQTADPPSEYASIGPNPSTQSVADPFGIDRQADKKYLDQKSAQKKQYFP
jgi:hypothetical protein